MKKKESIAGIITIVKPTLILAAFMALFLAITYFTNFIFCTLIEKTYFDGRYDLAKVYVEMGALSEQCRVHCVYEDETDFSFEIVGYYDWFFILPAWGFECTYIPSVMENKIEEVQMLNEEYAEILCWTRGYGRGNSYDNIFMIGNVDEEQRNEYLAEYICRLDEIYSFQMNRPDVSSDTSYYISCNRNGYIMVEGNSIRYSYSEDDRLTEEEVLEQLNDF